MRTNEVHGGVEWNAGWFGGQIGGSCWMLIPGIIFAFNGPALPAVILLGSCAVANVLCTLIWVFRQHIAPYPAIQLQCVILFVCTAVSICALDIAGGEPKFLGYGGDRFSPWWYLVLLIFPALMFEIHYKEMSARRRNASIQHGQ